MTQHSLGRLILMKAATLGLIFCIPSLLFAQDKSATKTVADRQLPPATKMEAFQPANGSVVILGFDDLGRVNGVDVEVRELKDARGASAKGLLVRVRQSEYREESSFVDADELSELLKGLDALLDVSTNPTQFSDFEVRYKTKGDLELSAYSFRNSVEYAVSAGRFSKAQIVGFNKQQMQLLREKIETAQAKLLRPDLKLPTVKTF